MRDLSLGEIEDVDRKLLPLVWETFHRRLPRFGTALLLIASATVVYPGHPQAQDRPDQKDGR